MLILFLTSSENAAIPVPTLEFAALALRNADYLLSRLTVPNSGEGKSSLLLGIYSETIFEYLLQVLPRKLKRI